MTASFRKNLIFFVVALFSSSIAVSFLLNQEQNVILSTNNKLIKQSINFNTSSKENNHFSLLISLRLAQFHTYSHFLHK